MKYFILLFLTVTNSTSHSAEKLRIVTSIPDIAEVVRDVGGSAVDVESLLEGTEDAHYVDALPSFIQKVAKADAVCIVGLDLEIGWIPKVLSKSGRAQVPPRP